MLCARQAAEAVRVDAATNRAWALVGDAAFGVPFFRALNDGMLCATELALRLAEHLEQPPHTAVSAAPGTPLGRYAAFFQRLGASERAKIDALTMGINAGFMAKDTSRSIKSAKMSALHAVGTAFGLSSPREADAASTVAAEQHQPPTRLEFYEPYFGHEVAHLRAVHGVLRAAGDGRTPRNAIFLLGDSSLDNKVRLLRSIGVLQRGRTLTARSLGAQAYCKPPEHSWVAAVNGFEEALSGDERIGDNRFMVRDIAFWVNQALTDAGRGGAWFCLNGAREESTIADRAAGALHPQDAFVRDQLTAEDIIIISVGGNDVGLKPGVGTIANMAALLLQPTSWIESGSAAGLGHFISLFKNGIETFIRSLTAHAKPRLVVVCALYFLDMAPDGSWADRPLRVLGYNSNPRKLQALIRQVFTKAVSNIHVEGVTVLPIPLYDALDGATRKDYVNRVEPSVEGGEKIARRLVRDMFAA